MLSPDHGEGGVVGDKVFAPGVHRTLDVPDGRHLVTSFEILLALALAPQTAFIMKMVTRFCPSENKTEVSFLKACLQGSAWRAQFISGFWGVPTLPGALEREGSSCHNRSLLTI